MTEAAVANGVTRRDFLKVGAGAAAGSFALSQFGALSAAQAQSRSASSVGSRRIHLTQGNATSPYAMLRLQFEPGEVASPHHVRFTRRRVSGGRVEIPYVVLDSVSWDEAVGGREEWGGRYAALNHWSGTAPVDLASRGRKKEIARNEEPGAFARLEVRDQAAADDPTTPCTVMYLLKHSLAPYARDVLDMELLADAPPPASGPPASAVVQGPGSVELRNLPGRFQVVVGGMPLLELVGYDLREGTKNVSVSVERSDGGHVNPAKPFHVEVEPGWLTQVRITGEQGVRLGQDWKSHITLLPNDSMVVTHGFAFQNFSLYRGGQLDLAIYKSLVGPMQQLNAPSAARPWWTFGTSSGVFVSTVPLDMLKYGVGHDNSPFINAEWKSHKVVFSENRPEEMRYHWTHHLQDRKVLEYFNGVENTHWDAGVDWFYRQYVVAFGSTAEESERRLAETLYMAAGWIHRDVDLQRIEDQALRALYRNSHFQLEEFGYLKVWDYFYLGVLDDRPDLIEEGMKGVNRYVRASRQKNEAFRKRHELDPQYWWPHRAVEVSQNMRICDSLGVEYPDDWRQVLVESADVWIELDRESSAGELDGKGWDRGGADKDDPSYSQPSTINMFVNSYEILLAAYGVRKDPTYLEAARAILDRIEQTLDVVPAGFLPYVSEPYRSETQYVFGFVDDTPSYSGASCWRGLLGLFHSRQHLDNHEFNAHADRFYNKLAAAMSRFAVWSHWLSDSFEMFAETPQRQGDRTSAFTTEALLYLQQDPEFFGGLVSRLLEWQAFADISLCTQLYLRSGTGLDGQPVRPTSVKPPPYPQSYAHVGYGYDTAHETVQVYYLWASHLDGARVRAAVPATVAASQH